MDSGFYCGGTLRALEACEWKSSDCDVSWEEPCGLCVQDRLQQSRGGKEGSCQEAAAII